MKSLISQGLSKGGSRKLSNIDCKFVEIFLNYFVIFFIFPTLIPLGDQPLLKCLLVIHKVIPDVPGRNKKPFISSTCFSSN